MLSILSLLVLAASPEVAVLSSSGSTGELRFQPLDAAALVKAVARFSHADGSPVLGALLPGSRVVVASAVMRSEGDLSFGSALVRLEEGKAPRVLADSLAYGSRPLVSAEGRVFVSRGRPGPAFPGEPRVDELTVDELDPRTARSRTVFSTRGFVAFLAGAFGREVLVYEVGALGSRLIAVHADSLAVRTLVADLGGPAHDFVVDVPRKRVLFTHLDAQHGSYAVEAVSLTDGTRQVLVTGPEVTLLPFPRADGAVLISRGAGGGTASAEGAPVLPAYGSGFERPLFEWGGALVVLHERPADFPSLYVVRAGKVSEVLTPPEARLDVAGVSP